MSGERVFFILRRAPYPPLLAAERILRLRPARHDPADVVSAIVVDQLRDPCDRDRADARCQLSGLLYEKPPNHRGGITLGGTSS